MAIVTIHAAKTNLSRLIERAQAGEEIIIARGAEPVVRLVPVTPVSVNRRPGALKGQFVVPDDFDDPLPEAELRAWEGGDEKEDL